MAMHLQTPQAAATWLQAQAVSALCTDHRKLKAGDAYLAFPGHSVDARHFVGQALQAGANACIVEASGAYLDAQDTSRIAYYPALKADSARIAAAFYNHPSRQVHVLAITGTNGKTSSAWWLSQALNSLGANPQCAMVGTLGIGIPPRGNDQLEGLTSSGLTTPDGVFLQRSLQTFVDQDLSYCALEASSIGIEEGRMDGTRIRLAVFTNFTQDHLDYHGTMQAYWGAKRRLFAWPGLQSAIVNIDDEQGAALGQNLASESPEIDLWTVSTQRAARLQARDITSSEQGLQFTVLEGTQRCLLKTHIIGSYNVSNLLGVLAAMRALGMDLSSAVQACCTLRAVPGRLQCLGGQSEPMAVVDYAHTPDALKKTLEVLKPLAKKRGGALWCVFGCGGDRDNAKRPLMGAIAANLADHVVLTSDNPRSEGPSTIINHILAGMGGQPQVEVQADRAMAIAGAIARAATDDIVLIAGKGHESTQEIAGEKIHFSDAQHAQQALAKRQREVHA